MDFATSTGTRWVTYQLEQIKTLNNNITKDERPFIKGIRKAACNLPSPLHQCF